MIDHVSIEVTDLEKSTLFYERVLEPLRMVKIKETRNTTGFGKKYSEFWINLRTGMPLPTPTSGAHVCLRAPDIQAVDNFYRAALENGAKKDGDPGLRPQYTKNYYAAFIKDPDGNRIEVVTFV